MMRSGDGMNHMILVRGICARDYHRSIMTVREELHKLIDTLADDQIADLRQYIDELRGEETLDESTLAAIREGLDDVQHGRVMDLDEYKRTRGL